jgi:hypothetical protein
VIIPELSTKKSTTECKGKVYRCYINQYYSYHKSIEVRKSLRLLKKESCSGCEKCDWVDEFLSEDIMCSEDNDYLKDLKGDKKYKLCFTGGKGYYPEDDWVEHYFKEIK